MFPYINRKLKCFIYTFVIFIFFVVVSLFRDPKDSRDSVKVFNLTNYILGYEAHLPYFPHGNEDCNEKYGIKMIQNWRSTLFHLCTNRSKSKISCYLRYDEAVTRRLCLLINTKIQLYEPYYNISTSDVSAAFQINMMSNIVSADCEPEVLNYTGKGERKMDFDSLLKVDEFEPSRKLDLQCEHNINHTVYWIWRWDATNAYHFMEDIINAFVSLTLLAEDPDQVEIAIYDGRKGDVNNPLFTLWSELFPKGVRIIRKSPFSRNTCFRRSITSMYGMRSHLTEFGGYKTDTHCSSPILKGFQEWATDKLQVKYDVSVKNVTLLFVSRQPYLNERKITRVIKNENVILESISENYPSLNIVIFRPENYTTFKEQMEIVVQGRIMVGVHGAGLVYSLFMSPGSQLIEIFMDDRNSLNRHFHNIASWMDLEYQSIGFYKNVVPPEDIIDVIDKAIRNLKL